MAGEPVGKDGAHEVVREVFAAGEDGHGPEAEVGLFLHLLAEEGSGAEVVEAEGCRQAFALGAFAGGRRPEQDDTERLGGGRDQWVLL